MCGEVGCGVWWCGGGGGVGMLMLVVLFLSLCGGSLACARLFLYI